MSKSIIRSTIGVSAVIFLSRLFGLLRNTLIASLFGTSAVASALQVAQAIPYLFRRVLGESALDAFFVPVYSDYKHNKELSTVNAFISNVITVISLVVIGIVIVAVVAMPIVILLFAGGLKTSSPEAFGFAIHLARIMMPFMLAVSLMAIFMGIFNANRNFMLPATNALVLDIALIAVLFLGFVKSISLETLGELVAYSFLAGGFFILFYQYHVLKRKYHFRYTFVCQPREPGMKRIFTMMMPAIGGMAVVHVNLVVDSLIASFISEGAIAIIRYAEMFIQFPIGVIGIAVFNTALPALTTAVIEKDASTTSDRFNRLLRFIFFLGFPMSAGLIAVRHEMIRAFYQYKNFTSSDTDAVASVLMYFTIGLVGYFGVRIVSTLFYAYEDVKTPFKVGIAAVIVNIALCLMFVYLFRMGVEGLALASSIASLVNIITLIRIAHTRYVRVELHDLYSAVMKSALASLLMFAAVWMLSRVLVATSILGRVGVLAALVTAGAGVFAVCCVLMKSAEFKEISGPFMRRFFPVK